MCAAAGHATPASPARARAFQQLNRGTLPALAGMRKRCAAIAVGQVHVGAALDQQRHDLLMARAAVAQDDGFQQPRPAQPVYVVGVPPSRQQRLHDLDVAAFACGDQRRAAIAVGAFQVCAVA
ncbi:hypothetical protein G6F57_022675 [Rhizopus arrhizus]|nr:hypothetical protein G6F57_022675 [Rhizopus arrhizus]